MAWNLTSIVSETKLLKATFQGFLSHAHVCHDLPVWRMIHHIGQYGNQIKGWWICTKSLEGDTWNIWPCAPTPRSEHQHQVVGPVRRTSGVNWPSYFVTTVSIYLCCFQQLGCGQQTVIYYGSCTTQHPKHSQMVFENRLFDSVIWSLLLLHEEEALLIWGIFPIWQGYLW